MIRRYRREDYPAVRDVCVRTGVAGGDATGLFASDDLIPDIFLRPYVEFEPELAFVVDDGGVGGYIVATADTAAFVDRYRAEWLPQFAAIHPDISDMARLGYIPERMLVPELAEYPAHLHIDLLPRLQGSGWGRRLVDTLIAELTGRGIRGLHLSLDPENTGARAFYDRLGFAELPSSTPDSPLLGMTISLP
jgi:ribosomal protein S18 acetylase RimI-like enzyme